MRRSFGRRSVLGCEHLEGRDCPAIIVFGGFMAIIGTSGADTVEITDDGAGTVTATLNGTTRTASGIQAVTVTTFGGDDSVAYSLTGDQSGRRAVLVDTGSGNDEVTFEAGNIGGLFTFTANGGAGDDTITATVAGEIDGYLAIGLGGGNGADTVSGEIDVAADSTGSVVAAVAGGFGDDDLTLNITGDGLETLDQLIGVMTGGPGTDSGTATDNVTQFGIEA